MKGRSNVESRHDLSLLSSYIVGLSKDMINHPTTVLPATVHTHLSPPGALSNCAEDWPRDLQCKLPAWRLSWYICTGHRQSQWPQRNLVELDVKWIPCIKCYQIISSYLHSSSIQFWGLVLNLCWTLQMKNCVPSWWTDWSLSHSWVTLWFASAYFSINAGFTSKHVMLEFLCIPFAVKFLSCITNLGSPIKAWGPIKQISDHFDPMQLPIRELPHGNVANLYLLYIAWCKAKSEEATCRSTFYNTFKEWKCCLRFHKKSTHSICKTCSELKTRIHEAPATWFGFRLSFGLIESQGIWEYTFFLENIIDFMWFTVVAAL